MESGGEVVEEIEEETQDSEVLDVVIPVQLEEATAYEAVVGLSSPNSSFRTKYYRQTYRPAWEQMPDFKGWLRGVVGEPTRAYCTYCEKTLHAHRLSLLKHTCTIRHQKAAQLHKSKKNKNQQAHHQQEQRQTQIEEVDIVLHEDEITQEEMDNEETETIEYAEVTSEMEDEENKEENHEVEEDEEEGEVHEIVFQKHGSHQPTFSATSPQLKLPVSTHVLDATRGTPISGLQVSLYKLIDGRWTYINEGITNINGRFSNFLDRADFTPGRYKLHFDVDRYFDARKQETLYPFIEIIFDCKANMDYYHIPLVLSPYGYSTYKGS